MNRLVLAMLSCCVAILSFACLAKTSTSPAPQVATESPWRLAVSVQDREGFDVTGARFFFDGVGEAPPEELRVASYEAGLSHLAIPEYLANARVAALGSIAHFRLLVKHEDQLGTAKVLLKPGESQVRVALDDAAHLTVEFAGTPASSRANQVVFQWEPNGEFGHRVELAKPSAVERRDLGVTTPGLYVFRCYLRVGDASSNQTRCFLVKKARLSAGENLVVLPIPEFRDVAVKLHGGAGAELILQPADIHKAQSPRVNAGAREVCDEEGVAHFIGIQDGTYGARASRSTRDSSFNVTLQDVVVSADRSEVAISDFALCAFSVEVENGAGVSLELRRVGERPDAFLQSRFNRQSVCDAAGRALFTAVPSGKYQLVTTPGTGFNVLQVLAKELEVHADLDVASVALPEVHDFKVTIENDRNPQRPVDASFLVLRPADGSTARSYRDRGRVDSEGRVCFAQIPAGEYFLSMESHSEVWAFQSHPVTVPAADLSLQFDSLFALSPLDFSVQIIGSPEDLEIGLQLEPFVTDEEFEANGRPALRAAKLSGLDANGRAFFQATEFGSYFMTAGPPNGPKKTAWIGVPPIEHVFHWSEL